jgi:hypothetical protein
MEKMENTEKDYFEEMLRNRRLKNLLREVFTDFLETSEAEKNAGVFLEEKMKYVCPVCKKHLTTLRGFEVHFKKHSIEDKSDFIIRWIISCVAWLELITVLLEKNTKKCIRVLRKLENIREKLIKNVSSP